jgi:hypothetical protein
VVHGALGLLALGLIAVGQELRDCVVLGAGACEDPTENEELVDWGVFAALVATWIGLLVLLAKFAGQSIATAVAASVAWFLLVVAGGCGVIVATAEDASKSSGASSRAAAVIRSVGAAGLSLSRERGWSAYEEDVWLEPPSVGEALFGERHPTAPIMRRFGIFRLAVPEDPDEFAAIRDLDDLTPDGRDKRWRYDRSVGAGVWNVMSRIGDVFLFWVIGERHVDARWHRLSDLLRASLPR